MTLNSKVRISDSLLIQEVDEDIILLDTNTQEYFTLSEVGKEIFENLSSERNLKDVHSKLLEKYDIESSKLENDLLTFINALHEKKFVVLS